MYSLYNDIASIAKEVLEHKNYCFIAIDGALCSGKSSLAADLKKRLDATVISTADFYLPIEKRSEERMSEAGGIFDYERFIEEVCNHRHEESFLHQPYDQLNLQFGKENTIVKKPIVIVEGTYSLHPQVKDLYDLNIFLKISNELQIARIRECKSDNYKTCINYIVPLEKEYFTNCDIENIADIVIETY